MTGLFLKDLISLKRQGKTLLIFFVMYIVLFIAMKNVDFIYGMIIIICTTLVLNTFSYDEASKWDYYALALPISKQQLVLCKYLLSVTLSFAGLLTCIIISVVTNKLSFDTWLTLYALVGVAILIISIMLPLLFKFGTQKARLLVICVILAPVFLALLASKAGIPAPTEATIKFLIILSPFVLAACFIASFFISCRIMEKKEI